MRNRKPHMNNICFEIDRFLRYRSQYEYIGIFIQFYVYQELCELCGSLDLNISGPRPGVFSF